MLGSRLGGFTDPRGSPRISGECCIPGSIRDGGIVGAPDSEGFSGMMPGVGLPPLSGNWSDRSTSAAMANVGKRLKMAMATSRGAFPDHHLVERERRTLPYRFFDHNFFTSSSVIVACRGKA